MRSEKTKPLLAVFLLPVLLTSLLLPCGCAVQNVMPAEDPKTAETALIKTEAETIEAAPESFTQPEPVSQKHPPEPSPLSAIPAETEPSERIEDTEAPPLQEEPSPLPPEPEKAPPEKPDMPDMPDTPAEPEAKPDPQTDTVPSQPEAPPVQAVQEPEAIPVTTLQPAENAPQEGLRLLDSFIATAYYLTGLTSTGAYTTVNHTLAVNPNIIPYGTHVWIWLEDGTYVGDFYAEDTGSNMMAHPYVIDIYMGNSYDACIQWGARNVLVYVEDDAV